MVRCAGSKRDRSPCTATVEPPQRYCWWHDPAHAAQRRRSASKAGKSKPSREIAAIKTLLEDLTNRVIGAEGTEPLAANAAAVAAQLINTRLRAIEQERRLKETEELEQRIAALEASAKGGQRWGT